MTTAAVGFETGTLGAQIAITDLDDNFHFDVISYDGVGTTATYDNTHAQTGNQSAKIVSNGSTGVVTLSWISGGFVVLKDHYGSFYIYLTSLPAATIQPFQCSNGADSPGIQISSTGKIICLDSNGGTATGTNTIALNQWVRIAYHVVHSTTAGIVEARLFNTSGVNAPTETIRLSGANTGAAGAQGWGFGNLTGGVATYWLDTIRFIATNGYPARGFEAGVSTLGGPDRLEAADTRFLDGLTTDIASGTDVATRTLALAARTVADTASGSDATTRTNNRSRTCSDAANGTDAAFDGFQRTTTDIASGTDVATRAALAKTRTASDTASGTDVSTKTESEARSGSDIASGTDSAARAALAKTRTDSDIASGTDNAVRAASARSRTVSDIASGTDVSTRVIGTVNYLLDEAGNPILAENGLPILLEQLSSLDRIATDIASGTDVPTTGAGSRTASDTASGTDAITRSLVNSRPVSDIASGTDLATRTATHSRTTTDIASGVDTTTRSLVESRTTSDSASGTDAANSLFSQDRTVNDVASGTDVATRSLSGSRTISDTGSGTDTATKTDAFSRSISDTASGTDLSSRTLTEQRSASDSASGVDTVTNHKSISVTATDSASGTDIRPSLALTAADSAAGTDNAHTTFERRCVDDASGIDDAARVITFTRTTTDLAGGNDVAYKIAKILLPTQAILDSSLNTIQIGSAVRQVVLISPTTTVELQLATTTCILANPGNETIVTNPETFALI